MVKSEWVIEKGKSLGRNKPLNWSEINEEGRKKVL